jgi:polar amino acid transport system substrate-binding protein
MIQEVTSERLSRAGLKTTIAENGKEGVEMVEYRIQNGMKPFDLIFMDIHMPVMDGFEAATAINKLNTGTPIIAVTPSVTLDDKEKYIAHGMSDCLNKPFTSQELSTCLLKYLIPDSHSACDLAVKSDADIVFADEKLKSKLIQIFIKEKETTYDEIMNALDEGDIILAHRLVHTLKSSAGLLGKTCLQKIAGDIENMLANGRNEVDRFVLDVLKTELATVLDDFRKSVPVNEVQILPLPELSATETLELFDKLETLLVGGDIECLEHIDLLRSVPGCDELVQQIEYFEFDMAIKMLANLRCNLQSNDCGSERSTG